MVNERSNPGCDSVKTPEKVFKRLRMADRAALRELAVRAIGEDSLPNTFNGASPDPRAHDHGEEASSGLRHPYPGLKLPGAWRSRH